MDASQVRLIAGSDGDTLDTRSTTSAPLRAGFRQREPKVEEKPLRVRDEQNL
ncbi:MAG: hypothetical protein ACREU9_02680 [Gammaproteobacteria bacterium]